MKITQYIDKKGNTKYKFHAYLGLDELTGKQVSVKRQGFTNKKQAEIAYLNILTNRKEEVERKITVAELVDMWLEHYEKTVKGSTFKATSDLISLHLLDSFNDVLVERIKPRHIQTWVNKKAPEIKKYKVVARYFKRILEYAVANEYIETSPYVGIIYPKNKEKKSRKIDVIWTKEELKEFFTIAKENLDIKWYAFFVLLANTGMRRGEALALEWKDIRGDMLTISKSRKLTNDGYITGNTKTGDDRVIVLDRFTLSALKEWQSVQTKIQGKQKIMFTNTRGDYIILNHPLKVLNRLLEKTDLPRIDVHRFRHIHTTNLILAGVGIAEVMDRLGHADVKTTINIYNHVMGSQKEKSISQYVEFMT